MARFESEGLVLQNGSGTIMLCFPGFSLRLGVEDRGLGFRVKGGMFLLSGSTVSTVTFN